METFTPFLIGPLLAAFFMSASPALAQTLCGPRDGLVEQLKSGWDEILVAQGLTNANDRLIELFASKDGKTWTLIITYSNGPSCIIIAGHNWQTVLPKLLKPTGLPV